MNCSTKSRRMQIHGNVCMATVVVTEQLDWKLHGFDLLSEHQWAGGELPLMSASWMVPPQYKPGEVAKSDWQVRCAGIAGRTCLKFIVFAA